MIYLHLLQIHREELLAGRQNNQCSNNKGVGRRHRPKSVQLVRCRKLPSGNDTPLRLSRILLFFDICAKNNVLSNDPESFSKT